MSDKLDRSLDELLEEKVSDGHIPTDTLRVHTSLAVC